MMGDWVLELLLKLCAAIAMTWVLLVLQDRVRRLWRKLPPDEMDI